MLATGLPVSVDARHSFAHDPWMLTTVLPVIRAAQAAPGPANRRASFGAEGGCGHCGAKMHHSAAIGGVGGPSGAKMHHIGPENAGSA